MNPHRPTRGNGVHKDQPKKEQKPPPWCEPCQKEEKSAIGKAHGIIELRHVDYISNHCSDLAPEPNSRDTHDSKRHI